MKELKFIVWSLTMPLIGILLLWTSFVFYNKNALGNWIYIYCVLYLINLYIASAYSLDFVQSYMKHRLEKQILEKSIE